VCNIKAERVRQGDLVLVELQEGCDLEDRDDLKESFDDLARETGASFLVVPENLIRDFRVMSLPELCVLQEAIEIQIASLVARDVAGQG
jgi:hypothetical protein